VTTEASLTRQAQVALTDADTRIFRNNVGTAWQGKITRNRNGSITIHDPRPVHFGLCEGSSDTIGIRSEVVTAEMVGRRIGRFVAIELKTPGAWTERQHLLDQTNFIAMVNELGGRAGFATSIEEARKILEAK
jgi:hypothetical protein